MNLDLIIFVLFLTGTLFIGFYWGRGVKNIQEYATGNRNFATTTLVATIVATFLGGDYLFITLDEVYRTGLHYAIGCLGMPIAIIIAAFVFIPRMGEFLGNLSAAESIGQIYGKEIRILSGICGAICISGFIAIQFRVFGSSMGYITGISPDQGIVLSAIIVILYSTFGGIRSVTFTDVIQFITFFMILPLVAFKVWYLVTSDTSINVVDKISKSEFDYTKYLDISGVNFWQVVFLLLLFLIPEFNPAMFQRIMIGRSIMQVKKAYAISGVIIFIILVLISWIAFLLYIKDTTLNPKELVNYIITQDFHKGFRGLVVVGIVAMAMSTADSNINTSAVLIAYDVLKPISKKISNELLIAKIVSLLIGIGSIFFAFSKFDLLELVFFTQQFYIPIISPLILMAVLGFRSGKRAAGLGILSGFIFTFWWRFTYMEQTGIDPMLIGISANLVTFILSHYLLKEPGGWIGIKDKSSLLLMRLERQRKWKLFINYIKNFNIIEFCKKRSPKNELTYTSFGIFSIISVFATVYSNFGIALQHENIFYIYEVIIIISLIFTAYPILPQKIKKESMFQVIWLLSIFSILVVMPTIFLLIAEMSNLQLVTFSLNLLVALLLTRGKVGMMMLFLGVYLGIKIFDIYFGNTMHELSEITTSFYLIYALLMIASVFIILLKPSFKKEEIDEHIYEKLKKEYDEQRFKILELSQTQDEFVRALDKMVIEVFRKLKPQAEQVLKKVEAIKNQTELKMVIEELASITEKLEDAATYLLKVIDQVVNKVNISISLVNMYSLLSEVSANLKTYYKHDVTIQYIADYSKIQCDSQLIEQIMNIIAQKVVSKPILVENSKIRFDINLSHDQKSFTEAEAIKLTFFIDNEESNRIKKDKIRTIKKIVTAHYGEFKLINSDKENAIIILNLPISIQKLRPKFMDRINANSKFLLYVEETLINQKNQILTKITQSLHEAGMKVNEIAKITGLHTDEVKRLISF